MPQHQRQLVGQDLLERTIADLDVQDVDSSGVDPDQNLVVPWGGFRDIGQPQRGLLLIRVDKEGLNRFSPKGGVQAARKASAVGTNGA